MSWIFKIETVRQEYTSGIKFYLFTFITITFMDNSYEGQHISLGLGIIPLEFSIQLSIWDRKNGK